MKGFHSTGSYNSVLKFYLKRDTETERGREREREREREEREREREKERERGTIKNEKW